MSEFQRWLEERTLVNPKTCCREWQGWRNEKGYGRLTWKGKKKYAHRLVVEQELGRELEPWEICLHACDNPKCCSLGHLSVGTLKDNAQDMHEKGRGKGGGSVKMPKWKVRAIKYAKKRNPSVSPYVLAEQFDKPVQTVRDILSGKTWGHLQEFDPQLTFTFDPFA